MKRVCLALGMALVSAGVASAADWYTKVDDDVFSGKQTAVMFGGYSNQLTIYFKCDSDHNVTVSIIFPFSDGMVMGIKGAIVLKIDAQEPIRLEGDSYQHNTLYGGFKADLDDEQKSSILKAIAEAKQKILVGLAIESLDTKDSYTISASGSSKAAYQFIHACQIY